MPRLVQPFLVGKNGGENNLPPRPLSPPRKASQLQVLPFLLSWVNMKSALLHPDIRSETTRSESSKKEKHIRGSKKYICFGESLPLVQAGDTLIAWYKAFHVRVLPMKTAGKEPRD